MSQDPSTSFLEDSFFSEILSTQSNLEALLNSDRCIDEKIIELKKLFSGSNIQNVPIDILDEKIFGPALASMQNMHFKIIKTISSLLRNKKDTSIEDLKRQLHTLLNLLSCWAVCICHIKSLEKISIIDIKSVPDIFFKVIIDTFTHCKNSVNDYEEYFQFVSELLTSLFRTCSDALNSFYCLMDTVILFNTNQEEEMHFLLKILDETGKLATIARGMDAKTLVNMWKRFGKFSAKYNLQIKSISPSTITYHFKGLSKSIIGMLSGVNQFNQCSSNERIILCCRLLLKILEKLCVTYCGWILNDVMIHIIIMLTNLYRYSEQCLKVNGYNSSFVQFIASNFSFTFDEFLEVIFKNDIFKLALFNYEKIADSDALGYHMLLLSVIKKLSILSYEIQCEWYNKHCSILEICFRNIDKLSKDICIGNIQIQVFQNTTQGSYLASVYEATCVRLFSIVCQIKSLEFPVIVKLLLKFLLSGKFFSSLLSSDVWCFICRLGSSELSYGHFKYLIHVYEIFKERKSFLNITMLSNLLGRQYVFLSDKDKSDFSKNIKKSCDPNRWASIIQFMNNQRKKQLQSHLNVLSLNEQVSVNLKNLEKEPSLINLSSLMKNLFIIEANYAVQNEQSIDIFINMWEKIICILSDCEGMPLLVLEDLTSSLLRASHPQIDQSKYMTSIFESVKSLYPYTANTLRLEICQFFHRCAANITTSCNSSVVAELCCYLLSDTDPCVHQQAFEAFECLTRLCPDTSLLSSVALSLRNAQSDLSRTLPAYLSGEPVHKFTSLTSSEEFFVTLCYIDEKDNKHFCLKKIEYNREEKLPKLNEDVEKQAEKVCEDLELIIKLKEYLGTNVHDRLYELCQRFLDK